MILIAHRGNTHGSKPERENDPKYVMDAIADGYDVEIDLWVLDRDHPLPPRSPGLYLGHDEPTYKIDPNFLTLEGLWIHCKNREAFEYMVNKYPPEKQLKGPNFFWHQSDDFTITSNGYIWPFTDKVILASILNQPTRPINTYPGGYAGICSDNVSYYKGLLGL